MGAKTENRLLILFNAQHDPYIYGAVQTVQVVNGCVTDMRKERPFIVSKRTADGEEVVYGTVKRTLQKISSQLDRLTAFQSEVEAKLRAEGISPLPRGESTLPESEVTHRILDQQDDLVEDVLLAVSVNIRILSEIFPGKLKKRRVGVYDYDDGAAGKIQLSKIADLLLHNRYLAIRGHQVVDLISDEQFMAGSPQMGLKIDFTEYLSEVEKVVSGLTIKDLIGKLWAITKGLSTSSNIKDIVFLTQNLYTLGDSVVRDPTPISGGPLKSILDRVANNYIDSLNPNDSLPRGVTIPTTLTFRTPRFSLGSDLDHMQIRTTVEVNGSREKLEMDYEEFFREVSKSSGNAKLYSKN